MNIKAFIRITLAVVIGCFSFAFLGLGVGYIAIDNDFNGAYAWLMMSAVSYVVMLAIIYS